MNNGTRVHKWTSKSEFFDRETGEEISKQLAKRDYVINKKWKLIKIENEQGKIIWINECTRNQQFNIWGDKTRRRTPKNKSNRGDTLHS